MEQAHAAGLTESSLGQALAATGDHAGAKLAWSEALAIFNRLGTPEAVGVAAWLRGEGPSRASGGAPPS